MPMMHTDMDLMGMTEYSDRVSAVNMIGRGMWSEAAMATTEAEPPMELMAPMDVTTGPFNRGGVIQVNWTAVQNAAGYIVIAVNQGAPEADTQYEVVNDGSDETVTLSGLSSGSTYDIYVVSTAKGDYGFPEMAQTMVTAK